MTFRPFTSEHFITLGIGFVCIFALIIYAKRGERQERKVSVGLCFLNFVSYPFALFAWRGYSQSLDNLLPLHLCDFAAIVAGFALLTRRPVLMALTYFWGIAATTQALLTPAISIGPPALPFMHFFVQHFVVVAAALYMPIVLKWRPHEPLWRTPLIVFGISVAYQGMAFAVNTMLGTNFAFASRPPDNPSLIDHLGPWPLYLFAMQGLALLLFFMLVLPFSKKARNA